MSSSRVPSTIGRTRFTSSARASVPSIESTATVYAIQASAGRAAPRSAASTARTPAAALLAVSRWTAQAAARRSGPAAAVTPRSRRASRPPWAALYCGDGGAATTRHPGGASAAAAHAAAAAHLGTAQGRREGGRADLEARAHHRGARHREMRVADDDARLVRAAARAAERDQPLVAAVAQPARQAPAGAERSAHGGVDDDAAGIHQERMRRRRRRAVRQRDRPLPDEAASLAERHREAAHEDRCAGRVAGQAGDERAWVAEVALAVTVGVGL